MSRITKVFIGALVIGGYIALFAALTHGHTIALLSPAGPIAAKELHLMVMVTGLMLLVVIPVFILTFGIVWRYRADNKQAKYAPNWDHNNWLEAIWWGFPCLIIIAISILSWQSSHELDPFKSIDAGNGTQPLTIEVIALPWKWLFIYPDQHIATVNMVKFPVNTPVNFEITSDAPMNSFWIPQLGGQIYAMPGMSTQLHLEATQTGSFRGSSANLSGAGFSSMDFSAVSTNTGDFDAWVANIQGFGNPLPLASYNDLAAPSTNNPVSYYAEPEQDLYTKIIMKYMMPSGSTSSLTTEHSHTDY
jgi:cytochrome o ubiquinol oxidase subunit 2